MKLSLYLLNKKQEKTNCINIVMSLSFVTTVQASLTLFAP